MQDMFQAKLNLMLTRDNMGKCLAHIVSKLLLLRFIGVCFTL